MREVDEYAPAAALVTPTKIHRRIIDNYFVAP
jgi:hypothetical protein